MRLKHSRDQESPHKPKEERTTETIPLPGNTRHSFRAGASSVSYHWQQTYTHFTHHPGPDYLLDVQEGVSKNSLLPWEVQTDRGANAPTANLLPMRLHKAGGAVQMFAKSNRRCFSSWNFVFSSLHPASKGSSNMTQNWGLWQLSSLSTPPSSSGFLWALFMITQRPLRCDRIHHMVQNHWIKHDWRLPQHFLQMFIKSIQWWGVYYPRGLTSPSGNSFDCGEVLPSLGFPDTSLSCS